eukprot:2048434-Pyramimonas_sp.AAC.1
MAAQPMTSQRHAHACQGTGHDASATSSGGQKQVPSETEGQTSSQWRTQGPHHAQGRPQPEAATTYPSEPTFWHASSQL